MNCEAIRDWLKRDLDGAEDPSGDVAAHLHGCAPCAAFARQMKAIAEAARDALPDPSVPAGFRERVMERIGEPTGEQRLREAARPRLSSWALPVVALLLLPLGFLLRRPVETVALEALTGTRRGDLSITALDHVQLAQGSGARLLAGDALVEASGDETLETPLAGIRMRDGSVCTVRLLTDEGRNLMDRKKLIAGSVVVTLLAGGVIVANAEGEKEAEAPRVIRVSPGAAPRIDDDQLVRELDLARADLERVRARLESLSLLAAKARDGGATGAGVRNVINQDEFLIERWRFARDAMEAANAASVATARAGSESLLEGTAKLAPSMEELRQKLEEKAREVDEIRAQLANLEAEARAKKAPR